MERLWINTKSGIGEEELGFRGSVTRSYEEKTQAIPVEVLEHNMHEFLTAISRIFDHQVETGKLRVNELELLLEIDGSGNIRLLGSGNKTEEPGTIKIKLTRE